MLITPTNNPLNADLPEPTPKAKRGRKAGYESSLRKTGYKTKVARIPTHWDVADITDSIEYLTSLVEQYENEIKESIERSDKGQMSNRYEKLAVALAEIRAIGLPKV